MILSCSLQRVLYIYLLTSFFIKSKNSNARVTCMDQGGRLVISNLQWRRGRKKRALFNIRHISLDNTFVDAISNICPPKFLCPRNWARIGVANGSYLGNSWCRSILQSATNLVLALSVCFHNMVSTAFNSKHWRDTSAISINSFKSTGRLNEPMLGFSLPISAKLKS